MNENIKAGSDIHAGDGGYSLSTQAKYDEFVKGRNHSIGKARIKLLAEQATTYIEPTANSGEGRIFDKEKFAELIVKECADYVQFYYKDHACEIIAHDMKQHFGVEE